MTVFYCYNGCIAIASRSDKRNLLINGAPSLISGVANVINELSIVYHDLGVLELAPESSAVYYF